MAVKSFRLPPDVVAHVERQAAAQGVSASEWVVERLRPRPKPPATLGEALAALRRHLVAIDDSSADALDAYDAVEDAAGPAAAGWDGAMNDSDEIVSVPLHPEYAKSLDAIRGHLSRSAFLVALLEEELNGVSYKLPRKRKREVDDAT